MELFIRLSFGLIEHNEVHGFKFCHRLSEKLLTAMNILIGIVDISLYGVTSVAPVLREKIFTHIYFLSS